MNIIYRYTKEVVIKTLGKKHCSDKCHQENDYKKRDSWLCGIFGERLTIDNNNAQFLRCAPCLNLRVRR